VNLKAKLRIAVKRIPYHFTKIEQILTPFDLKYEQISLSNDLQISLANLFPVKSIFYFQKNPGIFSVSFLPDAPYGPDANTLTDFLFTDLNKALSDVKDFFKLKEIEIISQDDHLKEYRVKWSRKISKRHEEGILVDVFEFYKLHMAAIKGRKAESILMSIFIDNKTMFCLQVPAGMPIKDILLFLQKEHNIHQNPASKPFHPILRREIDPETEIAGNKTALLMFTHSGYTVAPYRKFLLNFPYFHPKKIGIRKGECCEKKLLPCMNCLACSTYCPANLYPSFLYHSSIHNRKDETLELNITSCIQCGKCSIVCPANLPLCETIAQTIEEYK
jgi:ferredoxin